ncbi:MAG TPA: pentapeptide repeat-containing protein [Nitrospira sp.]|nr:pentapeptide repeat-containing protein [Nitrospira sp.]
MEDGDLRHINLWLYKNIDSLKNLKFPEEVPVDLDPIHKLAGREFIVESCIFEGDVVWKEPRIAEMPDDDLPIEAELIFRACTFKKPISWARCLFHKPVEFFSCRFEGCVDFTRSCFYGASFEDCTFREKVFFEDTAFLPVSGIASPLCDYSCPRSIEAGCASNFPNRPHCANFRTAVFRDGVELDWVRFDVPACFYKAEFHGASTFLQSAFGSPDRVDDEKLSPPISINLSYAEIFGGIEFHQGLRRILPWPSAEAGQGSQGANSRIQGRPPLIDRDRLRGGEIWDNAIRADMRYVHVHKGQGLRFHSENLSECFVLGTNLEACHFINVRWPMVDSYFPLQFKTSSTLVKHWFGELPSPCLEVRLFAGFGSVRDLVGIFFIGPFHLVQSFIATAVRVPFRWMVRHDKPGNDWSAQQTQFTRLRSTRHVTSFDYVCSLWIGLKSHLWFCWITLNNYLLSCTTHEQHGIFDHKEQIREQEESFPRHEPNNTIGQPSLEGPRNLYRIIKGWRDKWTQLSRAYRDLKAAYEGNKDYIYASDFHFAEKELRRINHEVPRHTRLQLHLYWLVSGYGERVLRPIWWFIAIWLLGALPYYLWGAPPKNEKVTISVHTTAKVNCEPQLPQCDLATQAEGSERNVSSPEQAVE